MYIGIHLWSVQEGVLVLFLARNDIFGPQNVRIRETPLHCDAVLLGERFVPVRTKV